MHFSSRNPGREYIETRGWYSCHPVAATVAPWGGGKFLAKVALRAPVLYISWWPSDVLPYEPQRFLNMVSRKSPATLCAAGLRPTRQRIALGWLLFAKGDRHLIAENLQEEAQASRVSISLATIYNRPVARDRHRRIENLFRHEYLGSPSFSRRRHECLSTSLTLPSIMMGCRSPLRASPLPASTSSFVCAIIHPPDGAPPRRFLFARQFS
jgi:Ferric uptake regulator family